MDRSSVLSALRDAGYQPYEASARVLGGTLYVMADQGLDKYLLVAGENDGSFSGVTQRCAQYSVQRCMLTHENCAALQSRFPYAAPVSLHHKAVSVGLGDRLGICTGAHIQALAGTGAFPVLAQQSKRELSLTGRSYRSMLDDVAWQVFQSGYEGGYAADGDHLKTLQEVQDALADGATMITLDCSEHINNSAYLMDAAEAGAMCRRQFSAQEMQFWTDTYCGKRFPLEGGLSVCFDEKSFPQLLLTYGDALRFARQVYEQAIVPCPRAVSFEISIDETEIATEACAHYFAASELCRMQVKADSVAPRFCGEFQKGVDYIGEIERFQAEFPVHAAIARHFGYRISVHSGSDKFSVFPTVGRETGFCFHLKTSGTSWVEAVRVIAQCDPGLFRRMFHFSCQHFEEALPYYHVSASVSRTPDVDGTADGDLPGLLDETNTRQVMHITYGLLLQAKGPDGAYTFRDDIYRALKEHQRLLDQVISRHIRRHLEELGVAERCEG